MASVNGGPDLPKQANGITAFFEGGPDQPYVSTRDALCQGRWGLLCACQRMG